MSDDRGDRFDRWLDRHDDRVKAAERTKVLAELAEHIGAYRWYDVRLARTADKAVTEDVVAVADLEEFIDTARIARDPGDDPRYNDPANDGALDTRTENEGGEG